MFAWIGRMISRAISSAINAVLYPIRKAIEFVSNWIISPILKPFEWITWLVSTIRKIMCALGTFPNRLYNIQRGFNEIFTGIAKEFVALGVASAKGVESIADIAGYISEYISTRIKCIGKFFINLWWCLIFYIIEVSRHVLYLISVAPILFVFYIFGLDLYPYEEAFFDFMYEYIQYPDWIMNGCFTCARLKGSAIANQGERTHKVFTEEIPEIVTKPLKQIVNGTRHFGEVFNFPQARHPDKVHSGSCYGDPKNCAAA